jgi:hypothetical protein
MNKHLKQILSGIHKEEDKCWNRKRIRKLQNRIHPEVPKCPKLKKDLQENAHQKVGVDYCGEVAKQMGP